MEDIKNLIVRFRQTGFLFITGLILIIYISLGFVYLQQGPQQREFEKQITSLTAIVSNPLPSDEELKAEHDAVLQKLSPMSDAEAIALLVDLAKVSGIDIDADSGKFQVPTAKINNTKLGENTYRVISFSNILLQGDYDNVMKFISALDSGSRLETMVLTRVVTDEVEVTATGEEGERRAEFRGVASAVKAMMLDNGLAILPYPMSFNRGTATNYMGDAINTVSTAEGFPDITTPASEKGYTGVGTPRNGYVLYGHDKVLSNDTTKFETVNYFSTLKTTYYYTCEANGTVRQWDGPNIVTANEYLTSQESKVELRASVDVNIYTRP